MCSFVMKVILGHKQTEFMSHLHNFELVQWMCDLKLVTSSEKTLYTLALDLLFVAAHCHFNNSVIQLHYSLSNRK